MRKVFLTSDETRAVITCHAKELAKEYGCDPSYYYQINSDHETDGFEKFLRSLFEPALRCGLDVTPWITRLMILQEKYRPLAKETNIARETARFTKEASDVPVAHINGDDLERQLAEIQEANARGRDLEQALLHAINERDEQRASAAERFGNAPVSFATRNKVRRIVESGKR